MGREIPLVVHPNLPAGTVFFYTAELPYAVANVTAVARMLMRQDYYSLEWPLKTRKYEYGVYADGVLQHFAPFSMGIITNIGNGNPVSSGVKGPLSGGLFFGESRMADLTTLANVKGWLGVTATTDDALLTRLISAASDTFRSGLTARSRCSHYTETRDGTGGYVLPLSNYPVSAVSSLTIEGFRFRRSQRARFRVSIHPDKAGSRWRLSILARAAERCRKLHGWLCHYAKRNRAGDDRTNLDALQGARPHRASQQVDCGETITFSQKDFSDAIETTLSNYRKVILL